MHELVDIVSRLSPSHVISYYTLYIFADLQTKLFVSNLPLSTTEDELKELFGAYGELDEVCSIIILYTIIPDLKAVRQIHTINQCLSACHAREVVGSNPE